MNSVTVVRVLMDIRLAEELEDLLNHYRIPAPPCKRRTRRGETGVGRSDTCCINFLAEPNSKE